MTASSQCADALASAVGRATPENFTPHTSPRQVVNGFNSWLARCAGDELKELTLSDATQQMLSPNALRYVAAARFTVNDAVYLRDALLLKSMTEVLWKSADNQEEQKIATEEERIQRLFEEVVRNVSLMPSDRKRIPVGLFEVLLTGTGTAEDRAWVFAEALRQRKIDAVLLVSDTPVEQAENTEPDPVDSLGNAAILMAVVLENNVVLFDPAGGTAAMNRSPEGQPATVSLEDLNRHPRWKQSSVQIVAQPCAFAPRMYVLEQNLLAKYSAVLYEELAGGTTGIRPLVDRIAGLRQTDGADRRVLVWSYPEQQIDGFNSLQEEQRAEYTMLLRPFDAPFERNPLKQTSLPLPQGVDPNTLTEDEKMALKLENLRLRTQELASSADELFGRESRRLLTTRIRQLNGEEPEQLIPSFQQVAIGSRQESISIEILNERGETEIRNFPMPEMIRQVHQSATGNAIYWTAMCQLSRGSHGTGVATFRSYRRQFPEGDWIFPSMLHEAASLRGMGNTEACLEILHEADRPENPERIRVRRMLAILAAETRPPEESNVADPPPAE
ncbi:MAG: hypothetical protein KDA96_09915 [Planctomycetaceae bacterium]|nr:hypothetical protein [Planctomycetaceae bacterium]